MFKLPRILIAFTLLIVLVFSNACARKDAASPTSHDSETTSKAAGPLQMQLTISPSHPRMIKPVSFALHISEPSGHSLDNLTVAGRLTMPAMNMPPTELTFEPKGDGNYEVHLKDMDMSGPWTLTVDASGEHGRLTKSFEFVVGE